MRTLLPRSTCAYEYRSQLIRQGEFLKRGEEFLKRGERAGKLKEGESFERKKRS
jgi:hypothetical protein